MIKAAIVGATGYTGSELVRVLIGHPHVTLECITSESHAGKPFSSVHPQFEGICDMPLCSADEVERLNVDVCFLALPHGVSMDFVNRWKEADFRIIDLSGDFRLSSAEVYTEWYRKEHTAPQLVPQVPYGLPELTRAQLRNARIVANPGCYPTASILALAPLVSSGLVREGSIIIDAKSGLTGAGVKSSATTHFSNVNDNFKAYGLKNHRHTIEVEEMLSGLASTDVTVQFTPHLLPVDRGILCTVYASPNKAVTEEQLMQLYTEYYRNAPFVRMRRTLPELKHVRGTNLCDISVTYDERTDRIIVISAIDNLVKGASGAAVQNMNIMFGLDETAGLSAAPLRP